MERFLSSLVKGLKSRKGSPTMEYVIVIACGMALALLLNQVMVSAEVQESLKDKIMQVLTGQNMAVSLDENKPKEQPLEDQKDDPYGKPQWIKDLTSGYESLKNKFKKGLSEAWENVKNKDLGDVTQSLWNKTTNAFDSLWQWAKENKEAVASGAVLVAGIGLLLIPGLEPLGLMLLANWALSFGFGTLLNGGKVDKTVLLGAAIGGAAGAIGGGAANAFFSSLTKLAPGLATAITGSRFLGPIISGGKQILGKAPAFVQRMVGGLFSKMGAMTATEGAITSGVDDWLRGKELNWKRAILSGLAGATLVGFASGAYPLVQPLINKATAAIEKHAGPVVAKIKPTIQNVDKCFGYQRTPRYFALIKFGNENFVECLYAQADRGGGSVDGVTRLEGRGKKYKTDDGALIAGKKVAEINNLPKYQTPTNNLDLDYVAEVRKKLGIPPLGNDKLLKDEGVLKAEQTVAVLQGDGVEIWGRNGWSADNKAEFKNMKSAWGKGSKAGRDGNKREKAGTNAQTWTHAEGDVFWYFYKYRKENQILGGKAKLVVDRPLCDSCGDQFKGVQNLMEEVGLDELIVVTPDNPNGIVYRPRPGMRRTTWKEAD